MASPSRPRITEIRAEAGILIAIAIWIGAGILDRGEESESASLTGRP